MRAVRGCLETLHGSAAQCQSRHQSQRRFPAERATMFQAHADACWVRHCTRSRSEEHMSELQSLMRISYAVFCLKKKNEETPDENQITQIDHTKTTKSTNKNQNKLT